MPNSRVVYTDGACSGNPGPGGWAWAEVDGRYVSGAEPRATNQRMEITAALEAVREFNGEEAAVANVSDSQYGVNRRRDRWHVGGKRRGWKNSAGKPGANRDLWEPVLELALARADITFRWVKGHGGDPMNDL